MPSQQNAAPQPILGPRWLSWLGGLVIAVAFLLGGASPALAQLTSSVPVDTLITVDQAATTTNYPTAPYASPCDPTVLTTCPAGTTNLTFGGDTNAVLQAIVAGGIRFEPATDLLPPVGLAEQVVFRRFGPGAGPGLDQRQLLFYESTTANGTTVTLSPNEAASIEEAMLSRVINRGIDNVFNNGEAGPGTQNTQNNIERIDYIIANPGVQVSAAEVNDVGFLILERGGNDGFGIAAITSVDGAGNPLTYGPLVDVLGADWGGGGDIGVSFPSAVLRKDDPAFTNPAFRPTHVVGNQSVRGIFFPISSLLDAPQNTQPFFGFSLFAADVDNTFDLAQFTTFPTATTGASVGGDGGLDLIAGGFGLIRRAGSFALIKRVTNLIGPATLPDFTQVLGTGSAVDLLRSNNLGQGLITIADPPVQTSNGIEYTIYLTNSDTANVTDVVVCDQIPAGTTFNPDGYGAGLGIEAIASSSPPGPAVTYTSAADGDPGTFFAPGAALPAVCGANQNNGAVVVTVGPVNANQVGLIRFRTTVN
ncbi:DUF11 domain-containing protein [Leptolyngbya sp. CCNP1308]|uniref:DUF11 domain-containing protein n=1 Tax=Leptolyngbya sp. CCNP1308 TaxID=3110255 RepID=UPI002B20C805|nr:DUF11 domain-containing protein [Leptolyngbya sp. CCNP1308]MEA5450745.1 DUF11 domain-containing protein [Leptolyngbya sp. CCNP1308]